MAQNGTALVPTLAVGWGLEAFGRELGYSQAVVDLASRQREQSRRSLDHARAAGVKVCTGTDAVTLDCTVAVECRLLVGAGYTNAQALSAATTVAAEVLGAADQVGSIQAGRLADMVAIDGDPLADISALGRARWVIQGRVAWSPERAATATREPRGYVTPLQAPLTA